LQQATRRIARGDRAVQVAAPGSARSGALEIDQLVADVNSMAVGLAALEDTRRRWIAQISHELRTPLAVLRGELEAIEDGARSPTPALLASLGQEVRQLTRLVDDLHTLSVADLGQLPCSFDDDDADAQLRRIAGRFATRAGQLGLGLELPGPAAPLPARWDFGRIAQLLGNLLENSLRYTQAPGRIRIDWQADGAWLRLSVDDSAPGVAPADRARLFEPLYRVDAARSRTESTGSGLGLSIAQAIAAAHRGRISLHDSPLGGLRVQVDLPLQPQLTERRRDGARSGGVA
ncbi:MAG: two-component sensor histidine kinase, partial [Rhodoferax sp.]|nr:two-component sensor histidine kinase [Rhodoferax sp.]